MPTISVIVPIYKVEPYLCRCVDSILGQTFTDFELILVDDGSPDNCGAICDEYAEKDSRVTVIHQENGGLSAARNAGIDWAFASSDSQWLTFVDSDDWIHPRTLEMLLEAANTCGVKISVCGYQEVQRQDDYRMIAEKSYQCKTADGFFLTDMVNSVVAWGKLYHKSCFESVRYPVGKIHEDEFVTYRLLYAQPSVAQTQEKLYFYFQNPQGITKRTWSPAKLDVVEAFREQACYFRCTDWETAKKRSIGAYRNSLLWQYRQYKEEYYPSRQLNKRFQKFARYYLVHFLKEDNCDRERCIHLLWMACPDVAKVYHWIKRRGLQKRK